MAQRARIKLASIDIDKINRICGDIREIAEKTGVDLRGPIPLPTKKLKVTTRKSPCGDETSFNPANEIYYSKLPDKFNQKRQEGEIKTTQSDFVLVKDLPPSYFDLVICRNVFYQIPVIGQKVAFYKISQAMKEGGLLLANDGHNLQGTPHGKHFMPDVKGWMDKTWQERLSLRKKCLLHGSEGDSQEVILEKSTGFHK
jgi:ribosomal protein S10